jgi:phosphatidylinositol alpha-mannosyltransferase
VLYIGRLEPRKGVAHLVRAMAAVQRRAASPPRLVVAGSGPDETELRRLASASGVDVRFAGRVSDDELPGFLQAAEIVCAPATGGESFGIVLLEAMAACRPLIASGIEGYRELVGDSGGARLVPPANPDALAAALSELLADEGARASLAAAGAAMVRSYDWNANAERLVALYYDAIGRRAAEVS